MLFESRRTRAGFQITRESVRDPGDLLICRSGRAEIVPDGFFPLKLGGHGFDYLTETQAAVDAALVQLLVIFSALRPERGLHEEKRCAA